MTRIIKYTLLPVIALLFIVSCKKEDFSYKGPNFVEFKPTRDAGSFQYYNTRSYYHNYNVAPIIGNNKLTVQLIGPHSSTPLEFKYEIKEFVYYDIAKNKLFSKQPSGVENTNWIKISSTAVKGVDYDSPSSGTFSIPANSSFGSFEINVLTNTDNTNTRNSKMIFIELVDTKDLRGNIFSNMMMLCFGRRNSSNPTIF